MSFGSRLEKLIKARGMSQREVSERCSLSQGHVSMLISGLREPGVDVALRLARVRDVSLDWLCENEREPSPLTLDENELIRLYRRLDPRLKELALESLRLYPH